MKNILMLAGFEDRQTGDYIANSFGSVGCDTLFGIDIRKIPQDFTPQEAQKKILEEVDKIEEPIDLIIVLKGLELSLSTLHAIQERHPEAIFINWFFDKYLLDKPIWESENFFDVIRFYDFFFCSLKGVADKLTYDKCLPNVRYLDEACFPPANGEVYINHFQEQKYGSDVAFVGSIGYTLQHADRLKILQSVVNNGFELKIWGPLVCDMKYVPTELRNCLTETPVINEEHSMVVQSSLINLSIDQDLTIELGHSARVYRVMAAGGMILSTATKGLDQMFRINGIDDEITKDLDMVVFQGQEDMVRKMDFLLEHDDVRKAIAKNGQKLVLQKHTFVNRLRELMLTIKNEVEK